MHPACIRDNSVRFRGASDRDSALEFIKFQRMPDAVRGPDGIFRGRQPKREVLYRLCFVAPADVKESDWLSDDPPALARILRNHFNDLAETIAMSDADFLAKYKVQWTAEQIEKVRIEFATQLREWGPTPERTVAVCRLVEVRSGLVPVQDNGK